MKSIVWACKEQVVRNAAGAAPMDYTPAERFGELRFISRTDLPTHANSSVREVWDADVDAFVREYNPNTDYIITTGQPVAIFAIGWKLGLAGKTPRFLVWRREDGCYRVMDSVNQFAAAFA